MRVSKPNLFWISYSDLMTSLFFIMLVLFVLAKVQWDQNEAELKAAMKELEERKKISDRYKNTVEDIERSIESLPTEYFAYDKETRRFKMMRNIEFHMGEDRLKNPNDREYIVAIGRSIQKVISSLQAKNYENVRYVVIIEGMSSKDRAGEDVNYPLSYSRAWRVKRIWDADAISFDKDIVDVQISGSGTGGIGRKINETENRQILIHIVPKIGRIGER